MLPHGIRFVGREIDLAVLTGFMQDSTIKIISIVGETGIGKTALANRLFEVADIKRFRRRFRHLAFRPGPREGIGWEGLEDWLISSMAREVLPIVTPNATRTELVNSILNSVAEKSTLFLLDNVESLKKMWFQDFIRRWLQSANMSLLIVTTTQELQIDPEVKAGYKLYRLSGFSRDEKEVILTFFQDMRNRFKDSLLLSASGKLRNSPQRLLWLQWLDPHDKKELNRLVKGLSVDKPAKDIVDTIQERIKGPLTHFLALGRVRTTEIEERLFFWLWDRLGGGSGYISVRDQLIAEGFLTRLRQHDTEGLRIHPSIHIQLENHFEQNVGSVNVGHIDYYLSDYYREQFEKQADAPDMSLLGRYVYHAIQARNLSGALNFVLAPDRLRLLHNLGMALDLRPVLSMLDSYITNRVKEIETELKAKTKKKNRAQEINQLSSELEELNRFYVPVMIELAQCNNDLSEHEQCLANLDKAAGMLAAFSEDSTVILFRQSINYLRGISFSDLGRSLECVQAYSSVVEDGVRQQKINERVILALGYLAFELRFHDPVRAQGLGKRALQLATQYGEPSLIAKNKCSLAQTLLFTSNIEDAARFFKEAEEHCLKRDGRTDRRELGRILIHQSMVPMAKEEYDKAIKMLDKADRIHLLSGDRRRLATSKALRGIILWHLKQAEEGKRLLSEAITQHYNIKDWRNLIMETLSYAFMLGHKNPKEAVQAASSRKDKVLAQVLLDSYAIKPLKLFGSYWASYFRPLLLE